MTLQPQLGDRCISTFSKVARGAPFVSDRGLAAATLSLFKGYGYSLYVSNSPHRSDHHFSTALLIFTQTLS